MTLKMLDINSLLGAQGCGESIVNEASFSGLICRGPVAQSVAMRAVNPGVVSSNPGSANFLSDDY